MPAAARLGDVTAHGGVLTSAAATVYIENKPAARVGDMHVCPMLEAGPIAHVGGGVLNGISNVMIEGKIAASVGSVCLCCGQPDHIAQGAVTVIFGGQSQLSRASQECINSLHQVRLAQVGLPPTPHGRHFLALQFCDEQGQGLNNLRYRLIGHGIDAQYGELDAQGYLRRYNLSRAQSYCVRLQALIHIDWDIPEAAFGDEVHVLLRFSDPKLQQTHRVAIYRCYTNGQASLQQQLTVVCHAGQGKQVWVVALGDEADFPVLGYYFVLSLGDQVYRSGVLCLRHAVDIQLHDLQSIPSTPLQITLADNARHALSVDGNGRARAESVSAGVYRFSVAGLPPIFAE